MSTESNIAWALLAFGLLAGAGGYAAGRKVHRVGPLVLNFRKAATRAMDDASEFFKSAKKREAEIAPSTKRFRTHGELPLQAAEKAYFRVGTEEHRSKLKTLREGMISLTERQQARLEKLWEQDIAFVAPIVARQSGITKIDRPRFPGKHHPDKLLPDQIHVGPQGAPQTTPAPQTAPALVTKSLRDQFHALKNEAKTRLGSWSAAIAEVRAKHGDLLKRLATEDKTYWEKYTSAHPEWKAA